MSDSTPEENTYKDKPEEDKQGEDKGDTVNNTIEDTGEDVDDDNIIVYINDTSIYCNIINVGILWIS